MTCRPALGGAPGRSAGGVGGARRGWIGPGVWRWRSGEASAAAGFPTGYQHAAARPRTRLAEPSSRLPHTTGATPLIADLNMRF